MPRQLTGPFSLFGRWIVAMCDLYAIPSAFALAQQAGISDNTLTECMREGKPSPTRNTVEALWKAFETMGEGSPLSGSLYISKEIFYNIAGYSTPEQQEHAQVNLKVLEYFASREVRIQELEKEVEELRSSRHRPRT